MGRVSTKKQIQVRQQRRASIAQRLHLPKTPLTTVFSTLKPDWRSYIEYVEIAAHEGDAKMATMLQSYRSLAPREQKVASPEHLCDISGVDVETLLAAIVPLIWRYANAESTFITAMYAPKVLKRVGQMATRSSAKDRELMLKVTGILPSGKSGGTTIINAPLAQAGVQQQLQGTQPSGGNITKLLSHGDDIRRMDAEELDD